MLGAITLSLVFGLAMIAFVTWYNSIISGGRFLKDFSELAGVMLGATFALYVFGNVIRLAFGITI
jgi:VIT1/CCC1 family predicted Fe2+/Mn2+ transporter